LEQILQLILNIKCYIINLIPSKLALPKPTTTLVAIDHQMAGKKFIEDVVLDGGSRVNIIVEKLRV
jgi:hypothetical protein